MVHGLTERPLTFTMDEIVRFPSVSRIYFLECSGNSAAELVRPSGKTAQEIHGLLSCAEWTGVRLATVLQEAGIKPEAKWLLAEGADAAAMTRSVPMAKALDDALLVYAQNGEMLRPEQGYPLRLFLPGFEGNMSVKWLRRLPRRARRRQTGQCAIGRNRLACHRHAAQNRRQLLALRHHAIRLHPPLDAASCAAIPEGG